MSKRYKMIIVAIISVLIITPFGVAAKSSYVDEEDYSDLDGKELFESLVFAQGELGAELYNIDPVTLSEEEKEVISIVIDEIEEKDPDFFSDFEEDIKSGNHYVVSEATVEAGEKTMEVLQSEKLVNKDLEVTPNSPVAVWLFYNSVAVLHLGGVVTTAAAVVSVYWETISPSSSNSTELSKEVLVNDIVELTQPAK